MYVVAGVTGNTGRVVAETLIEQGARVRVVVRAEGKGEPWRARGAEVAVADLSDGAALAKALAGATGAYLLLPPDMRVADYAGASETLIQAQASAVRAAKVPHVVLLSSIAAQWPSGNGPIAALHRAEQVLGGTGAALTAVRAAYFLENFGAVLPAAKDGALPSFLPASFEMDVVATADIGRQAAQALLDGPRGQRVIQLAGPRPVTPNDVAAALARILDRPVQVREAPTAAVVPAFTSMGVGATMARLYQELYEGLMSGRVAWEGGLPVTRGRTDLETGLRSLLAR
jgi:uncharacterized protein YbjT (DUF2867 family)